jgi:hypothetical protein
MESEVTKTVLKKSSSANKRMALTLLSIAVVFFASVIIKRMIVG